MLIPFVISVIFIALLMLAFLARSWWGKKEDMFYLSRKVKQEVIDDMLPPLDQKDKDPTVSRMLNLLSSYEKSGKN